MSVSVKIDFEAISLLDKVRTEDIKESLDNLKPPKESEYRIGL
jgi:hypothetical protein